MKETKRLSKLEIVRRLFRRFSTSASSPKEEHDAIRRIMTKLSTSILSPSQIKDAMYQLISKIK